MFSEVFISGEIGEKIDELRRFVCLDQPILQNNRIIRDKIPTKYWTNEPASLYMKLKDGTSTSIRGRIESDDKFGLIVVVELFDVHTSVPLKENK